MNPFNLAGPQFLLFYLVLGGPTLFSLARWRRARESEAGPRVNLSDPYLIAALRGGVNEALRVATVSLIDRGLLKLDGDDVVCTDAQAAQVVRRPLEKKILDFFATPQPAVKGFASSELQAEGKVLEQELARLGLFADAKAKQARLGASLLALCVLWGVALVKILLALARGQTNLGFLIMLVIVFSVMVFGFYGQRRTARGDSLLADLRMLFGHLKERAESLRPGGSTAEAALLAAVFGLGALPAVEWAFAKQLYPRASADASGTASCGSSGCGSSSCGSSCGGGCGGGCGGCGG